MRVRLVEAGAGDDGAVEEEGVGLSQFVPDTVSCRLVFGGQLRRWFFDETELGGLDDVNGWLRSGRGHRRRLSHRTPCSLGVVSFVSEVERDRVFCGGPPGQ